jgi:hypothetical protein
MQSRRLLALGGLWLAVSGAVVFAPGCYGNNCNGQLVSFGAEPGQGHLVDETTWESNAPDQAFLPFPRQQYYIFDMRALGGRTPTTVLPYIAAQANPVGGNFTLGAGNLALLFNDGPNRVDVKNDSCSDYFLRLVVTVPPLPPVSALDGGSVAAPVVDAGDAGP